MTRHPWAACAALSVAIGQVGCHSSPLPGPGQQSLPHGAAESAPDSYPAAQAPPDSVEEAWAPNPEPDDLAPASPQPDASPDAPRLPEPQDTLEPEPPTVALLPPEPTKTFAWGLAEPITWNTLGKSKQWDFQAQLDAAAPLQPELFLVWVASHHLFPAQGQLDPDRVPFYQGAVAQVQARGWTVILMDSGLADWVTGVGQGALPCYDPSPGSPYREFMARFEEIWQAEAALFPSVNIWIPGNEPNEEAFLHPATPCPGSTLHDGKPSFTWEQKARITVDMMYHAKRGILAANPQAFVYMPGLSRRNLPWLLNRIYVIIESGEAPSSNPRDYFDGLNWHPYAGGDPAETDWLQKILDVRALIEAHGDADIPVFFGEVGFSDGGNPEAGYDHADWLQRTAELAAAHLPWLTAITWFRLFDDPTQTAHEGGFGLMKPPRWAASGKAWPTPTGRWVIRCPPPRRWPAGRSATPTTAPNCTQPQRAALQAAGSEPATPKMQAGSPCASSSRCPNPSLSAPRSFKSS